MSLLIDPSLAREFDRPPPHSIEAEKCLIASLMLCEPEKKLIFAAVRNAITRECFYLADHQILFDALCGLHDRGSAIDAVILKEKLIQLGVFEEVGGKAYLAELLDSVPSYAHAEFYAKSIKEHWLKREAIRLSNDLLRACYAPSREDVGQQLLMDFASKASRVATGAKSNEVHPLRDLIDEIMSRRTEEGDARRLPTGLNTLDAMIGGLRLGGKMIIGAMPGMGKSALIKQILRSLAARMPVGLITVEETGEKVAENILSNESGVPNNRIAFGTAGPEDWNEVAQAAARVESLPFYIVDTARKLSSIIAMANVLACQYGCRAIAVDHLHIIDGETNEKREREISKISSELKWAWKDLNVAGIEAAQLNRGSGRERPTINSLRDSGTLGQDGDTIIFLHREDYWRKQEGGELDGILEAIIAKNKDSATGVVPLHFDEARQRITDRETKDPFAPACVRPTQDIDFDPFP